LERINRNREEFFMPPHFLDFYEEAIGIIPNLLEEPSYGRNDLFY